MDYEEQIASHWEKRDAKRKTKKRFTNDNRRSVRWLYWNSGRKAMNVGSNADTPSNML